MQLESNYIRTVTLGGYVTMPALGAVPEDYKWKDGICYNIKTGVPYPGNQKLSNCQALYGPYKKPVGWAAVLDFAKKKFLGEDTQQYAEGAEPSITTSSLLVPAVVVVGGVALLLILRKKK